MNLQDELEKRLRQRFNVGASPEYRLTWKHWIIGSRRQICALRASVRRIKDNDCSGWATPRQTDAKCGHYYTPGMTGTDLAKDASLAGWCSPTAQDHSRGVKPPRPQDKGIPLSQQVSGMTPCGDYAKTESKGEYRALNPYFSAWLMGFPTAWTDCARKMLSRCVKKSKAAPHSLRATETQYAYRPQSSLSKP